MESLTDLSILTAEMEEELDFGHEVLARNHIDEGDFVDILLAEQAYLESFLSEKEEEENLLIITYDEDDYILLRVYTPWRDVWEIFLKEEDYVKSQNP